ncbi:MAG: DUF262 domain-containing protein [Bacteroidetes bacterium]|nr:DUF262 domain-containing protein [Bacteroidota bacterium]
MTLSMKITPLDITVRELTKDYKDDSEGGVTGYSGRLNIRPPYQREFVYKEAQRNAVIDTVSKGYPLNVMYWAVRPDGIYEVIDGQQRTISIAQFVTNDFSMKELFNRNERRKFHALQKDEREKILNYPLLVYACEGSDSDRLNWFDRINTVGEPLKKQELRNAIYYGPWLEEAKKRFSRIPCPATDIGKDYVLGSANRHDFLERAIQWFNNGDIDEYMNENVGKDGDDNAEELLEHFESVISWVNKIFPAYRKEMKGVDWGSLYRKYRDVNIDPETAESKISELMQCREITKRRGIYSFVFSLDPADLHLRLFTDQQKRIAYEKQQGKCAISDKKCDIKDMQADHKQPWSEGGLTEQKNCQMVSISEHRKKTAQQLSRFRVF